MMDKQVIHVSDMLMKGVAASGMAWDDAATLKRPGSNAGPLLHHLSVG
jgi:hypothetical protein